MAASARHPCLYCTATTQDIEASNLRTIGSLKMIMQIRNTFPERPKKGQDHYNVKNDPYS